MISISKQDEIKLLLEKHNIAYIHNRKDKYSHAIPDFEIILKNTLEKELCIILEVDEGQHKTYSLVHEQLRIKNLHDSKKRECSLFIRYNPDEYKIGHFDRKQNQQQQEKVLTNTERQMY